MKKSVFLLGLLAMACLAGCGDNQTKFEMSFEDALENANHSAIQDVLLNTEDFQQTFDVSSDVNYNGSIINGKLSSNSKQNLTDTQSESSTTFDVKVSQEDTYYTVAGSLDTKFIDNTIFLNLGSLDIAGSEDMSMIAAITEGFTNQRFSIPTEGIVENAGTVSYMQNIKNLSEESKDIIINEGLTVYSGRFSQYNGYNARKFSIDSDKLQNLITEYYNTINEDDENVESPEIDIKNFDGYLIITGKDQVATAIENMDISSDGVVVNVIGLVSTDRYELNMSADNESILSLVAQKKKSDYEVTLTLNDLAGLNGKISPKISKNGIELGFNVTLTINSEYSDDNTVIPLKGSRTYKPISAFSIVTPEESVDLTEMLSSYLGGMLGTVDYSDYENYNDYADYDENYDRNDEEFENYDEAYTTTDDSQELEEGGELE